MTSLLFIAKNGGRLVRTSPENAGGEDSEMCIEICALIGGAEI
jgi:hypothetical protein